MNQGNTFQDADAGFTSDAIPSSAAAVQPDTPFSLDRRPDAASHDAIDDNQEPIPRAESGDSAPESGGSVPLPADGSCDTDIPAETKKWVDDQIPKKKTGKAIISLAKNRKRKDLADMERYVALLIVAGTIPMSKRGKLVADDTKNAPPTLPSAALQGPHPGTSMEVVDIPLTEINLNAQIRVAQFNEDNVKRIMGDFESSDPIDLFRRPEGELDVGDGFNRIEAAIRLGRTTIRARIHEGTLFEALIFGYKTNDRHGLPLGKEDRKKALSMIMATPEGSKLTGDELADKLGVSRQTIHSYLKELRSGYQNTRKPRRIQADEETARKKAFTVLARIEASFGLPVFLDFVKSLDDGKQAELLALLGGEAQ